MSEKIRLTAAEKVHLPDIDREDSVHFSPKCGRSIPADQQACIFCKNTGAVPHPVKSGREKAQLILLITLIFFLMLVFVLFLTRKTGLSPR